jgi:hypothetical protein
MIPVSLKTGRSVLELCEIGEQGGLTTDGGTRLYALRGGRQTRRCGLYLLESFGFIDELQPSEGTREGAGSEALRRLSPEVFRTVVTWLILPVVICLSQRLSHACLSINKFVL